MSAEISYLNSEGKDRLYNLYDRLPDYCPLCRKSIIPEYILIHYKSDEHEELLCYCPNGDCSSLFFAVYKSNVFDSEYKISHLYPFRRQDKEFPVEIAELSPEFISIYNQAHHAEQEKLDMICGVGYRKGLEFLIKDFTIRVNPDKVDKIGSMPLQQCIQKYIDMPEIIGMAERAVWLGNDETHYVRKWEDKDINDLKKLIDLTVYFISMRLKAIQYMDEMTRS